MRRLTYLIAKLLKYTERKALEKRRAIVATHGGGMEEKCRKKDQNLSSNSNLGPNPWAFYIFYKNGII